MSAELVEQLGAMGFSRNRAVRALHATGTDSIVQAVNWIVEHGEDADVDTLLLLPKARPCGGPPTLCRGLGLHVPPNLCRILGLEVTVPQPLAGF